MAENVGARVFVAPAAAATTLSDLPDDLKVLIFEVRMQDDPTWVRETFPFINRACRDIFRTPQASPLHETVHVDFTPRDGGGHVLNSSVVAWCAARAEAVRKLVIDMNTTNDGARYYTQEDVPAILRFVGPQLTELSVKVGSTYHRLAGRPLRRSLGTVVAPAANLRSLHIETDDPDLQLPERDAQTLARLTRLEKLVLKSLSGRGFSGTSLPVALCSCTRLPHLELKHSRQPGRFPAQISSLQHLEALSMHASYFEGMPAELGALTGLTRLELIAEDW